MNLLGIWHKIVAEKKKKNRSGIPYGQRIYRNSGILQISGHEYQYPVVPILGAAQWKKVNSVSWE